MKSPAHSSRATLTGGPVGGHLRALAVPMGIGIASVALFNVIDTWFISRLGTLELAAISFTFPVVTSLGSVAMGLGIGTTAVVSRAIGEAEEGRVKRLSTDALLLSVTIVLALSVVGYLTIDPVFRALGATDAVLPSIREYMSVWYVGIVFLVVPMVGMAVIRAGGDTRTPAMVMVFAGALNAALDPLLIFGLGPIPALGIRGAAIATVLSRATTLVIALWILVRRERVIDLTPRDPRTVLRSWRALLEVGLPAAGSNVAVPMTMAFVTALVAGYGETAVAAFGAGGRLEMLSSLPMFALAAGLTPFVGQNWGAGRRERVRRASSMATRFSVVCGLGAWALLAFGAPLVAAPFSDDAAVLETMQTYLWVVPAGFGLQGALLSVNSVFNAGGHPLRAAAVTLLRAPVLIATFTWAGGAAFGLTGVFAGLAAGNVVAGLVAIGWVRRTLAAGEAPPAVVVPASA